MSVKKFYGVIGNPPYQEETEGNGRDTPIYPDFMSESYKVAERVELITPARFLFNAGQARQTNAAWIEEMLSDKHLKVLEYEPDATKVFAATDIKGGVAVTIRNESKDYGAIHVFTAYPELNSIVAKVLDLEGAAPRLDSIFGSQRLYKLSDAFFNEFGNDENVQNNMSSGTRTKIVSSFVEKMPHVFIGRDKPNKDEVRFLSRIGGKREWRCVKRAFLKDNDYIDAYKLYIPEANNSGVFGETLSDVVVGRPGEATSDTFLNAGPFNTEEEASNLAKYYRTKFFRALLGVKKVTQHSPSIVWETIPLQDFTTNSDIDWSKSIPEIDKQLYKKYGLSDDEIEFIETHVKEMA